MGLNWNEIKSRALLFSKTWGDASSEKSQATPFWIDFFEIFGITNKRVASKFYGNFTWPGFAGGALSDKHRNAIEQTAQSVLDARAQFADASLADLYDPLTMPPALLKAHQKLDTAVDAAYQPRGGKKSYASDAERVAFLFELYQRITSLLPAPAVKKDTKLNPQKVDQHVRDNPNNNSVHLLDWKKR
jgi:hypothetical protein